MKEEEKYNVGTREDFLIARKKLMKERMEQAKDPINLIPLEDLYYYLTELRYSPVLRRVLR